MLELSALPAVGSRLMTRPYRRRRNLPQITEAEHQRRSAEEREAFCAKLRIPERREERVIEVSWGSSLSGVSYEMPLMSSRKVGQA